MDSTADVEHDFLLALLERFPSPALLFEQLRPSSSYSCTWLNTVASSILASHGPATAGNILARFTDASRARLDGLLSDVGTDSEDDEPLWLEDLSLAFDPLLIPIPRSCPPRCAVQLVPRRLAPLRLGPPAPASPPSPPPIPSPRTSSFLSFTLPVEASGFTTDAAHSSSAPLPSPPIQRTSEVALARVPSASEMLRTFDWASTSLGPRDGWSQTLKTMISVMENTPRQVCLWCGPDLVLIYNDRYGEMLASKHVRTFGQPAKQAWSEIWEGLSPLCDRVRAGEGMWRDADPFFFERNTRYAMEECYHSWVWVPVHGKSEIEILLNITTESTDQILAERRLGVLRLLAQKAFPARSTLEFWTSVLETLSCNPHDIPLALLYSVTQSSSDVDDNDFHLKLEGSIGGLGTLASSLSIPARSTAAMDTNEPVIDWPIAEAIATGPIFVSDCRALVKGHFECRSWELPDTAIVIPVSPAESDVATNVLILGLNSRRPFDESYENWIRHLSLQLTSGLTQVLSLEFHLERASEIAQLALAKENFFSSVSHELRTPLTLIQGPITDLLAEETNVDRKRTLAIAHRNCQRLSRLIDTLMDFTRAQSWQLGTFAPCKLGTLVVNLASLFRATVEKAGIQYIVNCDISDPRETYVDPQLLEKIIFNLCSNAYKYTLAGSIEVFLYYSGEEVHFGVRDTGSGIPQSDIGSVCERFHRVAAVSRSHEGTGIGLSLTRELVRIHGGSLRIESTTADESPTGEHGSTFTCVLPLGFAHLPPDRIEDVFVASTSRNYSKGVIEEAQSWDDMANSSSDGEASSRSGASGTLLWSWTRVDTVLIVDDNADMRRYLAQMFRPHVSVVEACDGEDALTKMQTCHPNLVISDYMMPRMDGGALIKAIRALSGPLAFVPIIILTAKAGEGDLVEGLLGGADDYQSKPFSSRELLARAHLHMALGKRRMELELGFLEKTILLKERADAAEFEKLQQQQIVDVSMHELRNLSSPIIANADIVRDNMVMVKGQMEVCLASNQPFTVTASLLNMLDEDLEAVDAISQSGRIQARISEDILSLARLSLSKLEIYEVEAALANDISRTVSVFLPECRMKDIKLKVSMGETLQALTDSPRLRILTDVVRITQVVTNFLSNSCRFTAPCPVREIRASFDLALKPPVDDSEIVAPSSSGGIEDLDLAEDETRPIWLYGSISDTGPGLSPTELKSLFQRFVQASQKTHAIFGGSGIGLYVCRQICLLMNGRVEVVSHEGRGSTFRFFVECTLAGRAPPSPSPPPALALAPSFSSTSTVDGLMSPPLSSSSSMPGANRRVLIVEDSIINRKVLHRQLSKANFEADLAVDGVDGLERIVESFQRNLPYHTVLMDLEMPRRGGIDTIRLVRELEASGELPARSRVIALTGNARQEQIDLAIEAGMDDIVLKPYAIQDLLDKLRSG